MSGSSSLASRRSLPATSACSCRVRSISISKSCIRPSRSCRRLSCAMRAVPRERFQLALDLQRIAQLLGRDANGVQPIGQVQAAGVLDRRWQSLGPAAHLLLQPPRWRRPSAVGRRCVPTAPEPPAQLFDPSRRDRVEHFAPTLRAVPARPPAAREPTRAGEMMLLARELVEVMRAQRRARAQARALASCAAPDGARGRATAC